MMETSQLTPADVIALSLAEFEERFGFRPIDALDKHWFAVTGKRITQLMRDAVVGGIIGDSPDLSHVVME